MADKGAGDMVLTLLRSLSESVNRLKEDNKVLKTRSEVLKDPPPPVAEQDS